MNRIALTSACLIAAMGLAACKIVKTPEPGTAAVAADASGDDARIAALLDQTFEAQLLPLVRDKATDLAALRTALAGGLDAAGAAHGQKPAGEGTAWNFPVKGQGKVVEANLTSRARVMQLDTDGDGAADVTLQLGPVVKGTALRDAAPFYVFTDFRDQIEFAKLGRALNDRASAGLAVPEGDPTGKTVAFTGVVPLKSATEAFVITPIAVEVGQ